MLWYVSFMVGLHTALLQPPVTCLNKVWLTVNLCPQQNTSIETPKKTCVTAD
jgi:hypothetical protein